jgi:hypothetical protein
VLERILAALDSSGPETARLLSSNQIPPIPFFGRMAPRASRIFVGGEISNMVGVPHEAVGERGAIFLAVSTGPWRV